MANRPAYVGADVPDTEMMRLLQTFIKRQKKAQGVAYLWASLFEACYYYAIPNRNRFWRPKQQQGEIKNTRIYDTVQICARRSIAKNFFW